MIEHSSTTTVANPFSTLSSKLFPRTIKDAFTWAQYLHDRFPIIGGAIDKVVKYFASDIDVIPETDPDDTDTDTVKNFQQLLKSKYNLLGQVIKTGKQLATMGNVFISAQRVFTRYLACPECSNLTAIKALNKGMHYEWTSEGTFAGQCPQCHKKVQFKVVDTPSVDKDGKKLRFIHRSARDMFIKYNELTGDYEFLYKLPGHIKNGILKGDVVYLENTPMLYLKAAYTNDYIKFPADKFLFQRVEPLSTMDRLYKGWGTPLFLSSFNNVMRLAYLDKFNEAVAMDYIAPIRMISPPPNALTAGSQPNRMPISGYMLKDMIQSGIKRAKNNPASWLISPVALNYQMLGGEAKQMAPVQLMKWYQDRILQDISIPVELRQTSFQAVSNTMGLRMFQRQWIHFSERLQEALRWFADQIADAHSTEHLKVVLNKTSFVEDDMRKQAMSQFASAGIISNDTMLNSFGLDFKEEQKKLQDQQKYQAQMAQKMEATQQGIQMTQSVIPPAGSVGVGAAQANIDAVQQANAPQDPAAAGAPAGAPMPAAPGGAPQMPFNQGNSQSATLDALFNEAQMKAQQIQQIGQTQGMGARMSALRQLKISNPTLHAQVKAILDNNKQQVASQAVQQYNMGGMPQ